MKPRILYFSEVKEWTPDIAYVGRPSKFGNPYSSKESSLALFRVKSAAEAVEKFKEWLNTQPQLIEDIKRELVGKDLACWCRKGAPCHARVIYFIANGYLPEEDPPVKEMDLF